MNSERWVRVIAGVFVLLSVILGAPASPVFVSQWFLAFTLFVGFNLLQSGFTCFCPLERMLIAAGVRDARACRR
ncbi:YgaP family membrane protein [Acidithiobacillus sulfuriphilus]|uniref:YgaP family membrane protein n=1 Tax=Acidithiobacillus sulfuriphilus TaxID=1867749 RepID=UPI003F61EAAD